MIPQGNWIFGLKPAPPPPPKKTFDVFWEALGKFVKKAAIVIFVAAALYFVYLYGFSRASLVEFLCNIELCPTADASPESSPLTAVPGEKLYSVVVTRANSDVEARNVINSLRASNIVSSQFFADGQYVIYIGNLSTLSQAETALQKVRRKGYANARIFP